MFQFPVSSRLSSRSSSSCLRLLPRLVVTSIQPSIFLSITCFRRQFQRKVWPIQLALFLPYVRYSPPPWFYVTLPRISHDRSNWSSPSFSKTFMHFGFTFRSVQFSAQYEATPKHSHILVSVTNIETMIKDAVSPPIFFHCLFDSVYGGNEKYSVMRKVSLRSLTVGVWGWRYIGFGLYF